ncbi:septal ring lytic transglycosylase RlpA family protein [Gilvimarinus sp. SDUM040013]|uniref:Endolytic peptidoglycan transglycosylase RlpA n=1 Tax=Gilvimarinus gilvus TaxID=3058038 RepID=A0ABU4RYL9_9GAMM|nr:septal ring lytic transglycosylase RlpA family protein [Gilvimarinus sp. SDUM040013]MDO3385283.1 septal ring lytic transglycosylase RlpA family protein [Gilvimarinus sp. SDUM040013]MDX6849266.1 septal ring lytic transglycosylase RlpA family protein [Gilvimarinus sp. SDUM040013]
MRCWLKVVVWCVIAGLAACSQNESRYAMKHDTGPDRHVDVTHIPDAVPKYEARTRAGNKNPYTVLGQTYYLIEDESDYKERGTASWYGKKFHGHKTSNGEVYDMYGMTAAHKTLPIPSYVRVTYLKNGRSVVVRVNDRGPFHQGRIIDLSYAAAQKLGIASAGTGPVEVEIVVPGDTPPPPLRPEDRAATHADGIYLQVGAFSSASNAKGLRDDVDSVLEARVFVSEFLAAKSLYRVRIGPLADMAEVSRVRGKLTGAGFSAGHIVKD